MSSVNNRNLIEDSHSNIGSNGPSRMRRDNLIIDQAANFDGEIPQIKYGQGNQYNLYPENETGNFGGALSQYKNKVLRKSLVR